MTDDEIDTTLAGPIDSLETELERLWADYQQRDPDHARKAIESLCERD